MGIWNLSTTQVQQEKPEEGMMGLIYGLHVYTTLIWPASKTTWKAHWERLKQNAQAMDLAFEYDETSVLQQIESVFQPETPVLRLAVIANTTQYKDFWVDPSQTLPSRLILSTRPIPSAMANITLQTAVYQRPMPLIKSAAMAESILLKRHAMTTGAHEVLFLGQIRDTETHKAISDTDRARQRSNLLRSSSWESKIQGYFLRECSIANIFILETNPNPTETGEFRNLRLRTPHPERDGCLPGITRQQILEIAQNIGLMVFEDNLPISLASLKDAEGVFIGNAASGLVTVDHIQHNSTEKPMTLTIAWNETSKACFYKLQVHFRNL
jgi:branched-subunit amino acid aminotransferase/4-amino-4-deoxychorismate lyase